MDPTLAVVVLGAAAAGFVQGLSGFAFGLVALAFWAWVLEPALAGPLVVVGSLTGQLFGFVGQRGPWAWHRALPFLVGGVLGVPLGVLLLRWIDPAGFKAAIGLLLLVWCPAMIFARRLPRIAGGGQPADAAVGWVAGVMGGLGGMTGPAPALWCTLRGWTRQDQRAVFQIFHTAMHVLTLAGYLLTATMPHGHALLFLVLPPAMLLPTLAGLRLYRGIGETGFRRVVLGLLWLSGAALLAGSLPRLLEGAAATHHHGAEPRRITTD